MTQDNNIAMSGHFRTLAMFLSSVLCTNSNVVKSVNVDSTQELIVQIDIGKLAAVLFPHKKSL